MPPADRNRYPVAVLMYHDVVESPAAIAPAHRPYVVARSRFRDHLRLMTDLNVSGTRLDAHLSESDPPRTNTCVITFDDGHRSNATEALPLLVEHRFRATFFLTVGWIGTENYLSWSQIRDLVDAGMEIGSHTVSHRPPSTLGPEELYREMIDSKRILEDHLGIPVLTASSPTGFYNPRMVGAAKRAGYRALCCGRIALWSGPSAPFVIPRIPVKFGTSNEVVERMVTGDPRLIASMRRPQMVRDGLKRILGVNGYLRLRRSILRLRARSG